MYGYTPPRQPEPGATRVRVCESEVSAYVRLHPQLTRDEILAVMKSAGPMRTNVETELRNMAEARRKSANA